MIALPSAGHTAAFSGVLWLCGAWLFWGLRVPVRAMLIVLGWLLLIGVLALAGYFLRFDQPWRILPTFGLGVGAAIWLAFQSGQSVVGRWLMASPSWAWVALHSFRLPLELVLHSLYLNGVIGQAMTFEGLNFDIVIGLTAPLMALLMLTHGERPRVRQLAVAWNLLGMVLLVSIAAIAVVSAPFSFQVFNEGPPNRIVTGLPFVWLPAFLVPLALMAHLTALRLLRASAPNGSVGNKP